ncbi:very short patch repair endonuclease [Limobrevibacterium gyesilva]|uniref:Very short patch repair endonuclease n=1 Tax=Limobrevibacterium gyesilva TaxID=2991712 RepID=A0AA42CJB8_9PROT|nr:very short patch repair endonuclease [Limobrevibacterium gyesilva]MCW3476747.1 very short patch repair endonuclease [Limobrevibacterium gyesilva]
MKEKSYQRRGRSGDQGTLRRDAKLQTAVNVTAASDNADGTPGRRHRGDIMSPEKRSAVMARIRGQHTGPERTIAALLADAGLHCERHVRGLPGRPDFVFPEERVAVLVDGDFWHGWRFALWRDKLSEAWEAKIAANRRRDDQNRRRLRSMGWHVVRLWEHQIDKSPKACLDRICATLAKASPRIPSR